jgi:hypothetical protein
MSERSGSRPDSVRLDHDEAWEIVRAGHTGIFTSLRRDGFPIATPLWYVVEDGYIWLTTPARTKKLARVRNDPRSSFLVESGGLWVDLQAVHLVCTATVVDDPETVARIGALKAEKYNAFRAPRADLPTQTRTYYAGEFVAIRLEAENRIVSWDNSRIVRRGGSAHGR